MKRFFEGASVVTAIFLLMTVVGAFFFNIHIKKDKNKKRHHKAKHHIEKKVEKSEIKKDHIYNPQIQDTKIQKDNEEELEYIRKMNDPLWHYYDEKDDELKVLPGKYGIDDPPGRQYMN